MSLYGGLVMEDEQYLELPELIELSEYGGDFARYLEAVYELFKRDFVKQKPSFRGIRLGLKKHPLYKDKEGVSRFSRCMMLFCLNKVVPLQHDIR